MYQLIRRLHLITTLFLAAFIIMYFVSGYVMIFEDKFTRDDIHVERIKTSLPGVKLLSSDTLVQMVMSKFDLRGQYNVQRDSQKAIVRFSRPGTISEVRVSYPDDSIHVEIKNGNFYSTLHQYHRLHGYHGGLNYFMWSFVYDLSSLSMIIFSLSGFYLWIKTERNPLAGWIVFITFTVLTFSTVFYLMYLS